MLPVVVIGILVVTGYLQPAKPPEPMATSYEVSLIGPTGTGKRKPSGERAPTSPRPSSEEKVSSPPVKGERREALPPKPQEKPKSAEPAKPKAKEPPTENPRKSPRPTGPSHGAFAPARQPDRDSAPARRDKSSLSQAQKSVRALVSSALPCLELLKRRNAGVIPSSGACKTRKVNHQN